MQRVLWILLAAATVGMLTYCDVMADEASPAAAGDEHGRIITGVASVPLHRNVSPHKHETDDRGPARLELRERETRVLALGEKRLVTVDGFDPGIINVIAHSDRAIRVRALQKGFTSLVLVFEGERRPVTMEVFVSGDTRGLEAHLERLYPGKNVSATEVQDAVVLRGEIESREEINGIVQIAEQFYPKVINQMEAAAAPSAPSLAQSLDGTPETVPARGHHVQLQVSVWHGVDRDLLREAGITPEMMRPMQPSAGDSGSQKPGVVGQVIQREWAQHVLARLQHSPAASVAVAPKVTTPDGITAHVYDHTEIPTAVISETVNGTAREHMHRMRLGTEMDLTPVVLQDGAIRLNFILERSRLLNSQDPDKAEPPQIERKKWQTESILKPGTVLLLAERSLFSAKRASDAGDGLIVMITPAILPADLQPAAANAQPPSVPPPLPRALSATPAYYPAAPLGRRMELSHRAANLHEAARNLKSAGLHDMAAEVTKQAEEAQHEVRRMMEAAAGQASSAGAQEPDAALRREIRELRGEVQELRRDVGRLLELLEKRTGEESARGGPSDIPDPQVGRLIEKFNELFDQRRYAEAEVIAKQARDLDPDNPVTEVLFWKARYARRMASNARLLDREDEAIFGHDWPITDHRSKDHPDHRAPTEEEQQIEQSLSRRISLNFEKAPLSEVVKHIATIADMNVVLDEMGLEEEGVSPDQEVTIHVDGIILKSALNLMLDPLQLGYMMEDEVLKITSRQRSRGGLEVRNYPVADFVFADAPEDAKSKALERLIEVISGTVEPDSWAEMGGPGSIRPYLSTLSLVVRQSSDVHEQIADLLQQLRQIIRGTQAESSAARDTESDELCVHAYAVADLVNAGPAGDRAGFVELTDEIRGKIAPDQWDARGGRGSLQPWEATKTLVIRQTPDVHRKIAELLNQMRREKSGRN